MELRYSQIRGYFKHSEFCAVRSPIAPSGGSITAGERRLFDEAARPVNPSLSTLLIVIGQTAKPTLDK
jgi:hypothetical protein